MPSSLLRHGIFKAESSTSLKEVQIECVTGYLLYAVIGWALKLYLSLLLRWPDNFEVHALVFIYIDNEYSETVRLYKYCGMKCHDPFLLAINQTVRRISASVRIKHWRSKLTLRSNVSKLMDMEAVYRVRRQTRNVDIHGSRTTDWLVKQKSNKQPNYKIRLSWSFFTK